MLRPAAPPPPAICGDAMLVPLSGPNGPPWPGSDEMNPTPGAATSGFICSETGVGPADEKLGDRRRRADGRNGDRAGCVARRADRARAELAEVVAGGDHGHDTGRAAPSIAETTMSRVGSTSGSPSERLITSIPSETAASIAAAISARCRRGRSRVSGSSAPCSCRGTRWARHRRSWFRRRACRDRRRRSRAT